MLPHIFWLIDNNFITLTYGLQRTGGVGSFIDHFFYPIIFVGKQIALLFPFLLMSFFLIKKFKPKIDLNDKKMIFLLFTTIAPIFLCY